MSAFGRSSLLKDRTRRKDVDTETLEDMVHREWVKQQREFARELMEAARLLLEHAELSSRIYEQQTGRRPAIQ
jgi:hypothetical protein